MFSLAEHYPLSEKISFQQALVYIPSDHFSFYYGYMLSEFCVCSGNDINNQKMFTSSLQPHFDFFFKPALPVPSSSWQVLSTASWASWAPLGFGLPKQAFTCSGHRGPLVESHDKFPSLPQVFPCERACW